jgi:hypothetical protein
MIELSSLTRQHARALFGEHELLEVERLLAEECGDTVPLMWESATPTSLERIRFAALRFSGGRMEDLRYAVALANRDWRDLLVAADFDQPDAHMSWRPRPLLPEALAGWQRGVLPEGVEFGPDDAATVLYGLERGQRVSIVILLKLEPEPQYLVRNAAGEEFKEYQRVLLSRAT